MDFTVDDFKCYIKEGSFHKFMIWMTQAMFGRPNYTALSIQGSDVERATQFISKILPDSTFHTRIQGSSRKRYPNNVTVFLQSVPRTQKQRIKVKDIMERSNVIILNPPWYFLEDTSIRQTNVDVRITDDCIKHADMIASLIRKSYCLYSFMPVYVSVFIQSSEFLHKRVDVYDAIHEFVEFWKSRGVFQRINRRELLANASLLAGVEIDFKANEMVVNKLKLVSGDIALNIVQFLYLYYEHGFALFQWLLRVAMGFNTRSIFVIADSTDTSFDLIKTFCQRCKVMTYDETNLHTFYDMLDHSQYHLHVFNKVVVPQCDLILLKNYSNCIVIESAKTVAFDPPHALCGAYKETTHQYVFKNTSDSPSLDDFICECYQLMVKEPGYAYYVQRMLDMGKLHYQVTYKVSDLLADYEKWFSDRGMYAEQYIMPNISPNYSFCFQISLFFKCTWDETTLCLHKQLKLNVM